MHFSSSPCSDRKYFQNYAGSGKNYDRVWRQYSYAPELVKLFRKHPKLLEAPKNILVLGAATGRVLKTLEKGFKAKCWGCEINDWAHARIPQPQRRRIRLMDMRNYVEVCIANYKHFDVSFSNSLIYLPKKEIPPFLKKLAKISEYIHFNSSFKGHACPDPYRATLETFDWWRLQFRRAGFSEVKIPGRTRSYLWRLSSPKS